MPYTKKELESNEYYQNPKRRRGTKVSSKKRAVENSKLLLILWWNTADGRLLVRDEGGAILLFESPYDGTLFDDESTVIPKTLEVQQYRINDPILDEIIDREITEL